jgi:hypothetical protein
MNVGHREQDRPIWVIDREIEALVGQQLQQSFGCQGVLEDHNDLGTGLFDGHQGVDPAARDHVDDREHRPVATTDRRAGYFWPAWIIAGWGVGMLLGLWNYLRGPVTDADVDDELRRMRR